MAPGKSYFLQKLINKWVIALLFNFYVIKLEKEKQRESVQYTYPFVLNPE